jgi:hypothetical protein
LIVFIHLQPVYDLWVRVDGDEAGTRAVEKLRSLFSDYESYAFGTFNKEQFELYYPELFQDDVKDVLAIYDKQARRERKSDLLKKVVEWTKANQSSAVAEWKESAKEPIEFLKQ